MSDTENATSASASEANIEVKQPEVVEKAESVIEPKKMSEEEREIEQKMVKVICGMHGNIQPRFKVLHMLSDQRNKMHDQFEAEIAALEKKFADRKRPILEVRQQIVEGKKSDYTEYLSDYDVTQQKLETIVAGVSKTSSHLPNFREVCWIL